jgi:PERQ amino acid-rich with GYF domain-containing protein
VKSDIYQEYRYPRAKLLDIYRRTSESLSFAKLAENFIETPELTQVEPVAPLALVAPDVEEGVSSTPHSYIH